MPIKGIFTWLLFLLVEISSAQPGTYPEKLISRLGCSYCHSSLKIESRLREQIPDLSYAGLRYNPAYLFEFLQNPTKIRRHIGVSKMPNFRFDEKEALALTLFLGTQTKIEVQSLQYPGELNLPVNSPDSLKPGSQSRMLAMEDTLCLTCHSLNGEGSVFAVDLATVAYRLKLDWVKKYLSAPYLFGVPTATMPNAFYRLSHNRTLFLEIFPGAGEQINLVTDHLFSFNRSTKEQLETAYQKAKGLYSHLTADMGEKIFRSQNCTACHLHNSIKPPNEELAPDLKIEGFRVNQQWLRTFLKKPSPIRPFGFQPGSGSRMPDFELSDGMVQRLTDFLLNQKAETDAQLEKYFPQHLTAFSMQKGQLLLRDKLPCLGCHRLGVRGGRIGPDLSSIRDRLNPVYIFTQINNPRATSSHSIMPKIPLPTKTVNLIFNYLVQQNEQRGNSSYLSLIENPPLLLKQQDNSANTYLEFCATCHGSNGNGNGYNGKYLPIRPTAHSDSSYMSKRPDDTLFDGIFAGGYILNKSHFMPPWGETLAREEIEKLVAFIRQLCNCQAPGWSRDSR